MATRRTAKPEETPEVPVEVAPEETPEVETVPKQEEVPTEPTSEEVPDGTAPEGEEAEQEGKSEGDEKPEEGEKSEDTPEEPKGNRIKVLRTGLLVDGNVLVAGRITTVPDDIFAQDEDAQKAAYGVVYFEKA